MKKHLHRLSHYRLQTLRFGELMPVDVQEVLPGDHWTQQTRFLLRAQPLVTPPMHPVFARTFSFFVPFRLLWDSWEDFIMEKTLTGVEDRGVLCRLPQTVDDRTINLTGDLRFYNSLGIGIAPTTSFPGTDPVGHFPSLNILYARAYNFIWNEWFRDQDIDAKVPFYTGQPRETVNVDRSVSSEWEEYSVLKARWAKDYYTTARPAPQLGDPGAAPVIDGKVKADDISIAFSEQRYRQRQNRFGGDRYTDFLANTFGVRPSDSRLQRPEFLGSSRQVISFSEVLSTADSDSVPVGALKGHGITAQTGQPFRKFVPEHGCIVTLMCIIPKSIYLNSIPAHFLRGNYLDGAQPDYRPVQNYFKPVYQNKGWQPVYLQEVQAHAVNDDEHTTSRVFGWQPRYQDYRFVPSYVSGEFRESLKTWHFARDFSEGALPALNSSFLQCDPSIQPFADQTSDQFLAMIDFRIRAKRVVPLFARN